MITKAAARNRIKLRRELENHSNNLKNIQKPFFIYNHAFHYINNKYYICPENDLIGNFKIFTVSNRHP